MVHNRKYVPGAIGLVRGRVKNGLKFMDQDVIEQLLIKSDFFETAPFKWVGLFYRYGLKNELIPEIGKVTKRYGNELPIAIELKMEVLEWADQHNLKLLHDILMIGALEALIHVGEKYNLPLNLLKIERARYGNIPENVEECEAYS